MDDEVSMDNEQLTPEEIKVFDIEIVRKARWERRWRKECEHHRVTLDVALNVVTCRDCKKELNPIQFMVDHMAELNQINDRIVQLNKAKEEYDKRVRVKCRHCGKMTPLDY